MTGKEMVIGIHQLDADLIEEAEFGAFRKKNRFFGKKTFLFVLAATLIVGAMTAAASFTRWSNTMQFGYFKGAQPSEEIKQQAEKTGLSVVPEKEAVSAADNGITVTLAQTVMSKYGGKVVFRISGMNLKSMQAPWAWWDFSIDGIPASEMDHTGQFFHGLVMGADGKPVCAKNGKPARYDPEKGYLPEYQMDDGSIEFSIDLAFPEERGSLLGKEMMVTFTGFGIQGETFQDEDIMVHSGTWTLRWILEGSTEAPQKWSVHSKIGHWDVDLIDVEIGQYSMKTTYRIPEKYKDDMDFNERTGWEPTPMGVRLKKGMDVDIYGMGTGTWDPKHRLYTVTCFALNTVIEPSQISGLYFYDGYELDAQGYRVDKPYSFIPLA